MSMASLPSSPFYFSTLSPLSVRKTHLVQKPFCFLARRKNLILVYTGATDNCSDVLSSTTTVVEEEVPVADSEPKSDPLGSNGSPAVAAVAPVAEVISKFQNPKWIGGTWDLKQFQKDGKTDWDSVIDAEVKRRKWLEDNPESSSNDDPVVFDTSIIPWWAWMKRFHLPEAELLNGRAAMIGFLMAYLVDSLTGVGLVDQMGNFFCKTLLFVAVVGVLVIRKNEDIETIKKLLEETTFYDKQWQATWQDDTTGSSKKD